LSLCHRFHSGQESWDPLLPLADTFYINCAPIEGIVEFLIHGSWPVWRRCREGWAPALGAQCRVPTWLMGLTWTRYRLHRNYAKAIICPPKIGLMEMWCKKIQFWCSKVEGAVTYHPEGQTCKMTSEVYSDPAHCSPSLFSLRSIFRMLFWNRLQFELIDFFLFFNMSLYDKWFVC
jgi:hypothetical protein